MIKRTELASQALASWTLDALRDGGRALARQELPDLDIPAFFRAFRDAPDFGGSISVAIVGFGVDADQLKAIARKTGATCFTEFATDLHAAADWRNHRKQHPIIVAYARGMVAGVNTLRHFAQATSRDLTQTLLVWAANQKEFSARPAHTRLLSELQGFVENGDAFSFEQVRAFLELWSSNTGASAPRTALPALGLLLDPSLFADPNSIRDRLKQNVVYVNGLLDRTVGQMEAVRTRLSKASEREGSNKAELKARLKIFDKLQAIRRNPSATTLGDLDLDDALKVFSALPESDEIEDDTPDDIPENRTLNGRRLQKTTAEALLDDRQEELIENADSLSKGLREALQEGADSGDEDLWESEVTIQGETQSFQGDLDRRFVGWVRHFCKADVWGGLVETAIPDLRKALEDYDGPDTKLLRPEHLISIRGEELGITKLLQGWEDDLASQGKEKLELVKLWNQMRALREQLLGSLEELTHFPLEWFGGKAEAMSTAEKYLKATSQLFGLIAKNYGAMAQSEAVWAKTTLDGLLALDVVQVRVRRPDDKIASKAVLLPMHPLHLWRYWRLSNLLRGLGKDLNVADRGAVIDEVGDPIQLLSVIYASKLPAARGAAQVLPVANDLYRLATFENLRNAYNGPDGQATLVYAVERFAATHRQHVSPLRLVLVNPPQAGVLILELIKLLDGRKKSLLTRLRVELRGTPAQTARLSTALLFDTREREIIEEKVASGQLELVVDRQPKPLDDILAELKARPAHIVAVFDEAPVSVRRGGAGQHLPMSPFCIRRKVAFHKRSSELRLEPTAGDPPFFEFIELVKHIEGNEGEGTPYAWPEAEALCKSVDSVLTGDEFGAHWFFLADRALPEEGELHAQRLVRRREGQRQVLLAARDYESLARLMLPVFEVDTPNLLMPVTRLKELLGEGAHLIGAGLLDVVKAQDGRVVPAKIIGLMGALLAARDYLRKHPGALLVSTDSQLARTWLRLGSQSERCDFLAVREDGKILVVECVEIKTTKGKPRTQSEPEIGKACEQVIATLSAVREGLGDTSMADAGGHYLAAPRNEMLKEVLVQGCMGRFAAKELREQWAGWLMRLFGTTPETPALAGRVIDVALGSAADAKPEKIVNDGLAVTLEHLNEVDIQRLLEPPLVSSGVAELGGETVQPAGLFAISSDTKKADSVADIDVDSIGSVSKHSLKASERRIPVIPVTPTESAVAGKDPKRVSSLSWPPNENVFGLIGQEGAASKLHNKAKLASGTGRRFTDTLFIGSAGVGKSSLARAVAKQLLDEDPVFFSGSDLPQPSSLIEKLRELHKLPKRARGRVRVGKCLVFIDEVHALGKSKSTATALLSAMDDARIATVGGVEYDFGDVIFIAATTDKGLLSDAFVSRMDIIPLAAYSLDELAGIICFHGRKLFGGFELSRDVCVEVAARSRCNPRRAVRSLENDLLAEFYNKLSPDLSRQKSPERAAAALMTPASVAAYYDGLGIDLNGLDDLGRKTLSYLKLHGATPEERLCRGLRISNRGDFVELIEYLTRLGLINTGHQGRQLTALGRRYIIEPSDLRGLI